MNSKLTGEGAAVQKFCQKKSIDVKKMSERQTKAGNLEPGIFLLFWYFFSWEPAL